MAKENQTWCDDCKACSTALFQKGDRKLCVRCVFNELCECERDAERYRWLAKTEPSSLVLVAQRVSTDACLGGPANVNDCIDAAIRQSENDLT